MNFEEFGRMIKIRRLESILEQHVDLIESA